MTDSAARNASAADHSGVGYAELVGRARDLIPDLRGRAEETERTRRLPADTEAALHDTGLFRMLQPARFGGAEADFGILIDAGAELAKGCASTSWVVNNLASHHWMLAMFPEQAQRDVWDDSPDHGIASSVVFPAGRARKVKGGYVLSGRWPFSSGVDCSLWNQLGGRVRDADDPDAPPEYRIFLLPDADYEIIDTWTAVGLSGTGSHDIAAEDVFVPEHRTVAADDLKGGPTPGAALNPGPLYQVPLMAMFPYILSGVALGNAEAAYDGFVGSMRSRVSSYNASKVAAHQSVQIRVGDTGAKVSAARRIMLADCEEAMRLARAGEVPGMARKVRFRRDIAFATNLCTEAVDSLFTASGGGGLYARNPIQRLFRDAHAIAAHIAFNTDVAFGGFGQAELGLGVSNPTL